MTRKELASIIVSFGLPCAYHEFKNKTDKVPPYVTYYYEQSNDLYADNLNYQKLESVAIELYVKDKTPSLEDTIESTLNTNGLTYTKYETYINDEQLLCITYYVEVILNG